MYYSTHNASTMQQTVQLCSLPKLYIKHLDIYFCAPCTTVNRFQVGKNNQNLILGENERILSLENADVNFEIPYILLIKYIG